MANREVYDLFVKDDGDGGVKQPVRVIAFKKRASEGTAASIAGWIRFSLVDPYYDNPQGGVVHFTDGIDSTGGFEKTINGVKKTNHTIVNHFKQYVYFINAQYEAGDTQFQSFWPDNITTLANVELWEDGIDPFPDYPQEDFAGASAITAVSVGSTSDAIKSGTVFDAINPILRVGKEDGYLIEGFSEGVWNIRHGDTNRTIGLIEQVTEDGKVFRATFAYGRKIFLGKPYQKSKRAGDITYP